MDTAHRFTAQALGAEPPALDLSLAAHKATRHFLFETLVQIGSLDVTDHDDIEITLNLLDRLLDVLGEPRSAWREPMGALRHGAASQRRSVAAALYRGVANLVARHLARLQRSEARWAEVGPAAAAPTRLHLLDDDELRDALHWMGGSLTPQELAAVLDELHAAGNAPRFQGALAALSASLDTRRWNQLARALGITAAPADAAAPSTHPAALAA